MKEQALVSDRRTREAILHQIQQLLHERVRFGPIWEYIWPSGVGPRVEEPALMLIKIPTPGPHRWRRCASRRSEGPLPRPLTLQQRQGPARDGARLGIEVARSPRPHLEPGREVLLHDEVLGGFVERAAERVRVVLEMDVLALGDRGSGGATGAGVGVAGRARDAASAVAD